MWYALIRLLQRHRLNLTVIFLYLLFTSIFTFPLFLRISTSTPLADGSGDQFQSMWLFWWFKTALLKLHTNPLYTNFIYHPQGSSLIYHLSIFLSLLALPFQYLFGTPGNSIISHNLILIFTFVFSGFGVYLLTKYLVKDSVTAFICGLLFAFCPYRLWHLNHLNLLGTEWIPFYILYLFKSVDKKSLKNFFWAGLFFILSFLSSLTYGFFLVLFSLFYLFYLLIISRKQLLDKRFIKNSSIVIFTVIIILSPLIYNLYSHKIDWQPSIEDTARYSANLAGYFLPDKERSVLGGHFLPSRLHYHGISGGELFFGYILLFFAIYTWIRFRRKKIGFWLFSSLAFFLLSFGHTIHIFANSYYFKWLPYNLLYTYVPLFRIGRTPCRFSLMVTLCLIIFSSYGLTRFFRLSITQNKNLSDVKNFLRGFLTRKGIPIVVVMLICLEFIVFPTMLIRVGIPECYEKIKNTKEEFAILELPAFCYESSLMCNLYMFYQTFHGKKVVNGYLSRPSNYSKDFLNQILSQENTTPRKISFEVDTLKLAKTNVKYILMHESDKLKQVKIEDPGCLVIEEESSRIKIIQVF